MPRESTITIDQVISIAESLKAAGAKPSARAIRERHGSGSLGTIQKLLAQWEASHIRQLDATLALPPALQRAILDFMSQELATARSELESRLADAQQATQDLATENERQADDIEIKSELIDALQTEKSQQAGRLGQLESDLAGAQDEIQRERQAAEAARTELAKAQLRLEAMPRLEADLTALRSELVTERQARIAAEQTAAVVAARLEASERRAGEIEAAGKKAEARIAELVKVGEAAVAEAQKAAQDLATTSGAVKTLDAKLEAATRELEASRKTAATAQDAAKKAGEEAAELRGQIKAAQDAAKKAGEDKGGRGK